METDQFVIPTQTDDCYNNSEHKFNSSYFIFEAQFRAQILHTEII